MTTDNETFARDYDREMFRSSVFSALWALIADRKRKAGFKLADLAETLGKDRGYVSRLFSRQENCKLNTISDLARALDAEVRIELVDRKSGQRFGPTGKIAVGREMHPMIRKEKDFGFGEQAVIERSRTVTKRRPA